MSNSVLERISPFLPKVLKPARYIGNEFNVVRKDPRNVELKMVISYPDAYEVGMSNLAIRILYECVNKVENFSCERVFCPLPDFEKVLRDNRIPLYSLETYTPLNQFDVLGFSIGYELLYTNVLAILDLGGIPLRSSERNARDPLIIAGGPSVYNPEPIADFIDVFIVGDGENALIEFLHYYSSLKALPRKERLSRLNRFNYTYIPSLYRTKQYKGYVLTDIDKLIKKKIEPDLEQLPYPMHPIVPLIKIVQDRITVEVNRGCTNGCRFCQAGYVYRPVRERSILKILDILRESLVHSGYDEVSLASLSIGDYTGLHDLVTLITGEFSQDNVSVSLPSLRVNSTNLDILEMIGNVRKSGLTFAIESADEDDRIRLNKIVDQNQLENIIDHIVVVGWRLVKLYFMVGLPMISDEQQKITDFIRKLKGLHPRLKVNANVSVFVPKPHTPFERENQLDLKHSEAIIRDIRESFQGSRVHVKFQNPKMSYIEGILSRGDRRVGELIQEVYLKGERFSSWDELFNYGLWKTGLVSLGIDEKLYFEIDQSVQTLPWYFIDCGVRGDYLREELEKARKKVETQNCLYGACSQCGICDEMIKNKTATKRVDILKATRTQRPFKRHNFSERGLTSKLLFCFSKEGVYRFISHLDLMNLLIRTGRIAGIPFRYSEGFNPKPRLTIPFALPLGVESDYELGEVMLSQTIGTDDFITLYNDRLPYGVQMKSARLVSDRKSIAAESYFHDYYIYYKNGYALDITDKLNHIDERQVIDGAPISFYTLDVDHVFIRLDGKKSIKKILGEGDGAWLDFPIRRVMIWKHIEQALMSFL